MLPAPPSMNQCTQSKCKAALPDDYQYKTCEKCRNISRLSMQKKRKWDKADEGQGCLPPIARSNSHLDEESDTELKQKENVAITFKDENALMTQLKKIFKTSDHIFFHGCYDVPADPSMSDKDHVKATAHEIWKVTGYRFT
ncbi:hypothetical protein EI94DRAFT_1816526 [Lactarius quietus]|nr:hypothetical protein EI94DRAFT_1816526 [Lactarius quietus]